MELTNGTNLKNRNYKILSKISQGNFGITYLAEQINLERKVCIKEFFFRGYCERIGEQRVTVTTTGREVAESFKRKFKKEALRLSQFNHPNIVKVIDIFDENDTVYMVMDFVKGETLQHLVEKRGKLSEKEAMEYIIPLCNALDTVHQKGLLHLDIKPSNIIIEDLTNIPVLIDFGISKYTEESGQDSNTTTPVALTKGYAPLEQYGQDVKKLTVVTDVYSVAATFYKLVTGVTPPEPSVIIQEGIKSPRDYNPSMSEDLSKVIMKALSYKTEQRPRSIKELMRKFEEISRLENESYTEVLKKASSDPGRTHITHENPSIETEVIKEGAERPADKNPKSNSVMRIGLTTLFLGLLTFGVINFYSTRNTSNNAFSSNEDLSLNTIADSAAYAIGVDIGNNIKKNLPTAPGGKELDQKIILAAFTDALEGNLSQIDSTLIQTITQSYFKKAQLIEDKKK